MSDDDKQTSVGPGSRPQDAMTDRLASLRASILASKNRTPTVPKIGESSAPVEEPEAEDSPPAEASDPLEAPDATEMVAAQPRVDEPAEEPDPEEAAPAIAEEPGPAMAEELAPAPVTPPLTESTTDDLHRVTPPDEAHAPTASTGSLVSQMDEASEAAEQDEVAAAADFSGPTVVQKIANLDQVEGTPLYMSPEQCRNDAAVTPATDVYSLGVMMFHLLERQPPYLGMTIEEVIVKHLDAPIPPQSSPFTPDDVKELIGRMLSKDAAERPSTAEIIEVLQRHVTISGPDVQGLEEESWTVSDIQDPAPSDAPAVGDGASDAPAVRVPTQLTGEHAAVAVEHEQPAKKPPVWVLAVFAVAIVAVFAVVVVATGGEDEPTTPGSDPPEQEVVRAADPEPPPQPEVAPEPEPAEEAPVAVEETGTNGAEPAGEMEFGDEATEEPVAEEPVAEEPVAEEPVAAEEPPAEEPPQEAVAAEEPKPQPKKPRKKKPKIRELRLEL